MRHHHVILLALLCALSASGASYGPGKVGRAFSFDGADRYIQIPDAPALNPANVTIEAWVWLDPTLPAKKGGEQIVFKKNTWSAWFEGYSLGKQTIDNGNGTSSDRFQFCVSRNGKQVAINSRTVAQRGVWYHVAATYDGQQSILYLNGGAEASATPGFALDYGATPLFIGTTGTWAPYLNMFGGMIDEVSLYNRALSASEIQAIYNAGSAGKCLSGVATKSCDPPPPGMVGWWKGEGNANDGISTNNGALLLRRYHDWTIHYRTQRYGFEQNTWAEFDPKSHIQTTVYYGTRSKTFRTTIWPVVGVFIASLSVIVWLIVFGIGCFTKSAKEDSPPNPSPAP